jgi:K+-sensing histidine kinase KdpD
VGIFGGGVEEGVIGEREILHSKRPLRIYGGKMAREKILIVDDEIETRQVCKRVFSKKNYSLEFAEDGRRALEMMEDNHFGVVLADLIMPGMGGLTVLERIKEEHPRTEVIIITGYANINTAVNAMRMGAYDYIAKPFDINQLVSVVGRCLEKQKLAREVDKLKEVTALYMVSKAIGSITDLDELLKAILKLACKTMATDGGVLMLFDRDGNGLFTKVSVGLDRKSLASIKMAIEKRTAGWMKGENTPLLLGNKTKGGVSGIAVPLKVKGKVIGVISVNNFRGGLEKFREESYKLLTIFATNASLAIENAKAYERLEEKKKDLEKANEQLRELDKLKSDFVLSISDALKAPLTAIESAIDLLTEKLRNEIRDKEDRLLEMAKNKACLMKELVDELLDFSRIEAGSMKLKMEKVSLSKVVSEVVWEWKTLLDKKRISAKTFLPKEPAEVFADRYRLKQALANIIKNGAKFIPRGGKVSLRVEDRKNEVWITVGDMWKGNASKDRRKIFDKSFEINQSWIRNTGRFGLGLSIARGIVEAHKGKIIMESKPNKSSKFILVFPKEKRSKPRLYQSELPSLFNYSIN